MDIESFPEFEAWAVVGYKSRNFARQKKPSETDSAAVSRIAGSWLGGAVSAARKAAPHSKPYLYDIWARFDAGYQITDWPMAKTIGLADMPSYYGVQNGLDVLARKIRQEREAVGTESELIRECDVTFAVCSSACFLLEKRTRVLTNRSVARLAHRSMVHAWRGQWDRRPAER
jgi:hypothetical protein